jgi:hypothetical protein
MEQIGILNPLCNVEILYPLIKVSDNSEEISNNMSNLCLMVYLNSPAKIFYR